MNEARLAARVVGDVSDLPEGGFGARNVVWWGNLSFMLIEGTGFALAIGALLYLRSRGGSWPPQGDVQPDLAWSTVFTLGMLASLVPNAWTSRVARRKDPRRVRIGMVVMSLIGLLLLGVRALELMRLNVRWDVDAYGSAVWMLMVLHTSHVATDFGETALQAFWFCTHEKITTEQFSDADDDAAYWNFVVAAWLPIYAVVYWLPRLT